jgi:hypothetical protein
LNLVVKVYAMQNYILIFEKQPSSMNYLGGLAVIGGEVEWLVRAACLEYSMACSETGGTLVDGHPGTKRLEIALIISFPYSHMPLWALA